MDYTYDQWKLAHQWAKNVNPSNSTDTEAAVAQVVLSSPEPMLMSDDMPEYDCGQYVGCRGEALGEHGWVYKCSL